MLKKKKKEKKNIKSVRKHVGIFVSGCRRSSITQHPRFQITACREPANMLPVSQTPRQERWRGKKEDQRCLRKWQWRVYSPSGSKRFLLKRNGACGGGGQVGVQACVHRGSASLSALPSAAAGGVAGLGLARLSESVQAGLVETCGGSRG